MTFFTWPPVGLIRQANSIVIVDNFKLKKISVKTNKGRLAAIQIGLGDGSVSPIFGE